MPFWDSLKAAFTTPLFVKRAPAARLPLPRNGWGGGNVFGFGTGAATDYRSEAGDIALNSAVAACLQTICTSWPQQVPTVIKENGDQDDPDPNHPFLALLKQPNEDYDGVWLEQAILSDFWTRGNAYCHIVLGRGGLPVELEYLPAHSICPKPDQNTGRLGYFEYRPNGNPVRIEKEEMLHFRFGINTSNLLEGRVPLESAYREIVADNNLSEWGAALAKNSGVPGGGILSPAKGGPDSAYEPITPDDAKVIKAEWKQKTSGANRGEVIIMPAPLDYHQVAFSPKEMSVSELRKTPEERICALFQIPPGVVQLGAGLDRNTYSNYEEAKKAAWEDNLIPVGDYFASVWTRCLRMFGDDTLRVEYDREGVRVLHEDTTARNTEVAAQYVAGLITLEEARAELGYETDKAKLAALAAANPPLQIVDGGQAGKAWLELQGDLKKKRLTR